MAASQGQRKTMSASSPDIPEFFFQAFRPEFVRYFRIIDQNRKFIPADAVAGSFFPENVLHTSGRDHHHLVSCSPSVFFVDHAKLIDINIHKKDIPVSAHICGNTFQFFLKIGSRLKSCHPILSGQSFVSLGFQTVTDVVCHHHDCVCNDQHKKHKISQFKNGSIVGNLEQPVQDQRYDTACSHDDICNEKQMYLTLFMLPVLPDQKYR